MKKVVFRSKIVEKIGHTERSALYFSTDNNHSVNYTIIYIYNPKYPKYPKSGVYNLFETYNMKT